MSSASLSSRLRALARGARVELSDGQIGQLESYLAILARWNSRVNLTGFDLGQFSDAALDRLVGEPLRAVPLVPEGVKTWFDLGSGGGSPAIPLKIARPGIDLHLVESRSRKAAFLREAVWVIGARRIEVLCDRVESMGTRQGDGVDLITIRAVRISAKVASAIDSLLRDGGRLLVFGAPDVAVVSRLRAFSEDEVPGVVVLKKGAGQERSTWNTVKLCVDSL
jgi:16S rRNA (guanine527-N7)-methyltransferase